MIYAERIRFRKPEREDIALFTRWINDPEVRSGVAAYAPMSNLEEERWFESMFQRPLDERIFVIEIADGEGWKPIGNIGLFDIDWRSRNAELGIMIGEKAYWNQGYGGDAIRLLLKYGFDTLNLHRVWLRVFQTNPRAIRSYEKVGFIHEGRKREAEFHEGKYIDVLLMSVLRQEWQG